MCLVYFALDVWQCCDICECLVSVQKRFSSVVWFSSLLIPLQLASEEHVKALTS